MNAKLWGMPAGFGLWAAPREGPTTFPCVDCGLKTGNFCDGGISVDYDQCYAKARVPADYLNAGTLRTPLCTYCETMYDFCRFCRGLRACTPFTHEVHWSGVPQHLSRRVTFESPAAAEASVHRAIRTPDKPFAGYFAGEPVSQEQRAEENELERQLERQLDAEASEDSTSSEADIWLPPVTSLSSYGTSKTHFDYQKKLAG